MSTMARTRLPNMRTAINCHCPAKTKKSKFNYLEEIHGNVTAWLRRTPHVFGLFKPALPTHNYPQVVVVCVCLPSSLLEVKVMHRQVNIQVQLLVTGSLS